MVEIWVDADACPVVDEVVKLASDQTVHLVHNHHHQINSEKDNVELHVCGDRQDQADHMIYNLSEPGDIVVTDDLGLAALVLSGGRRVVRFRGDRPTNGDIDVTLELRHAAARARRAGKLSGGPPQFTEEDREKFRETLKAVL